MTKFKSNFKYEAFNVFTTPKKKLNRDPFGIRATQERYVNHSQQSNYYLSTPEKSPKEAKKQLIRRHEVGVQSICAYWNKEAPKFAFEKDIKMGFVSQFRRSAIVYVFQSVLGAPDPSLWKAKGTIGDIMCRLNIPANSHQSVKKLLFPIVVVM